MNRKNEIKTKIKEYEDHILKLKSLLHQIDLDFKYPEFYLDSNNNLLLSNIEDEDCVIICNLSKLIVDDLSNALKISLDNHLPRLIQFLNNLFKKAYDLECGEIDLGIDKNAVYYIRILSSKHHSFDSSNSYQSSNVVFHSLIQNCIKDLQKKANEKIY